MRKLVSILLTLAVAVSLLVVPAVVSAANVVLVDFGPTPRTPSLEGTITEDGTNLYFSVTVYEQDAADDDYLAFWVDPDYLNKDLSGMTSQFDSPWNEHNKILMLNFFSGTDPKWGDGTGGNCPWGQTGSLPSGVSLTYTDTAGGMNWEGTIPFSVLGISVGDTFGYMFAARINTDAKYVDGYPEMVYGTTPGWDLRDYNTAPNTAAILTAETPTITAINVYPTDIDFGIITPGTPVTGTTINVENIGQVTVSVSASLVETSAVFQYLFLNGVDKTSGSWSAGDLGMTNMLPTDSRTCTTELKVPATYSGKGHEKALLVFEATAVSP